MIDKIQNKYDAATNFATDAIQLLDQLVDADILAEYANATSTVKHNDVGGGSAVAIPLTVNNVNRIFTAAGRKLKNLNVKLDNRFAVISPTVLETLQLYLSNKDTAFGDQVGVCNQAGTRPLQSS
jgi:hypothetical protein